MRPPSSHGPAGGGLPLGKPDPAPAVVPAPAPEEAARKALNEDHLASSPSLLISGKEMQMSGKKQPSALPSWSFSPPRAASNRSCQRKMWIPLLLLLAPGCD